MRRIDTSKWKEFRVGNLFVTENEGKQVPTGASIPKLELKENGSTPRISVTGQNNGILGYFDYQGANRSNYRVYNNFISVSFLGTVFYQKGSASLDMKVHCLKPLNIELNDYTGSFLVAAIKASLKNYAYSDQLSSTVLPNVNIKLPATSADEPNWKFMEDYMRDKEQQTTTSIKALKRLTQSHKPKRIDTSNWKEFYVGKLFPKIIKPRVYHSHEVKEEISGVPYIVRSKFNNGIKYRVNRNGIVTSPKGVISFGAENASFFYQEEEWCSGRDIYYIDTREIPSYSCRFLAVCLNRLTEKYSYNYGLFPELLRMEKILLPVTPSGTPDWELMEQYMRQVELQVKNSIIALTTPTPQIQQQTNLVNYGTVNIYEK